MTNLIPLYYVLKKTTHAMARLIFIPLDKIYSHRLNSKLSVTEGRAFRLLTMLIWYHITQWVQLSHQSLNWLVCGLYFTLQRGQCVCKPTPHWSVQRLNIISYCRDSVVDCCINILVSTLLLSCHLNCCVVEQVVHCIFIAIIHVAQRLYKREGLKSCLWENKGTILVPL